MVLRGAGNCVATCQFDTTDPLNTRLTRTGSPLGRSTWLVENARYSLSPPCFGSLRSVGDSSTDGWDPGDEAEGDHDRTGADIADEDDVGKEPNGERVGELVEPSPVLHANRALRPPARPIKATPSPSPTGVTDHLNQN